MNNGINELLDDLGYSFVRTSKVLDETLYEYTTRIAPNQTIIFVEKGGYISVVFKDMRVTADLMNEIIKKIKTLKVHITKANMAEIHQFQRLVYSYSKTEASGTAIIHYLGQAGITTADQFIKVDMNDICKMRGIGDESYRTLIKVKDALKSQ